MKDGLILILDEEDKYKTSEILPMVPSTIDVVLKNSNMVLKNSFGNTGKIITDNTLSFLKEMFEAHLECVADDPYELVNSDAKVVQKYIYELESYASELNIDIWKYLKKYASEYEYSRLESIKKFGSENKIN